jgi:protein SCO1/2
MTAPDVAHNARSARVRASGAALLLALLLPGMPQAVPLPPVDRVAFAPPPGAVLPLDDVFADESGRRAPLREWLHEHAAIVVPAYYGCSNLCTTTLRATRAALRDAALRAGRDVEVVAISIEPLETPALARTKKREVLGGSADAPDDGWHFLTGDEAAIARVTRELGYHYAYVADEHQYAHAAGIAIVAADGRLLRVLYGVSFPARALRSALASASAAPTTAGDSHGDDSEAATNWLLCFHYDPASGRYTFAAMTAVRIAGLLALASLAAYATLAWRRERRRGQSR